MYIQVNFENKRDVCFLSKNKNTFEFLFRDGNKLNIKLENINSYAKNGHDFTIVEKEALCITK